MSGEADTTMYWIATKGWWDVVGVWATALAALGTFAAVAVSLWHTRVQRVPYVDISASPSIMLPQGLEVIAIKVVNTGHRPFRVTSIGFTINYVLNKQFYVLHDIGPLPMTIAPGLDYTWYHPVDIEDINFYDTLASFAGFYPLFVSCSIGLGDLSSRNQRVAPALATNLRRAYRKRKNHPVQTNQRPM